MNSQEVSVSIDKLRSWRAARYLVIALALGGWLTGTAFAQKTAMNRSSDATPSEAADPPSASAAEQATPADQSSMPTGVDAGNYHVQSSIELGWRYSNITGNQANYDTFVNLQQGPRLLSFGINAYSLNHEGSLFDTLSLSGFGIGGDPDNVIRLRMSKNKIYNFDAMYRRDKYYFNYNLLDNPFNSPGGIPTYTVNYSPHALDLSRRMTSLNLTLMPQSSVRFRLGYSHQLLQGPSLSSVHFGTEPQLYQAWSNTTDIYHVGVDFRFLPRTMLSYDQFVQHFKQDTSFLLSPNLPTLFGQNNNYGYDVLTTGVGTVPVDLGFTSNNCNLSSIATCNAYSGDPGYFRQAIPRVTIPTERFTFQSTYFPNLTMAGHFSYASADSTLPNYVELFNGYESRTRTLGATTDANGKAKEVIVNGDWSGVYQVTSQLRAMDSFNYYKFNLPGTFNFSEADVFSQGLNGGLAGMSLPPATFNTTNCPAPYTAPACPQHGSSSGADTAVGFDTKFLGQQMLSNTVQLAYDFTPNVGASIGYRYTNRDVHDFDSTFYTAETFFPGGSVGANRGNCMFAGTPPSSFPVTNDDGDQVGTCTVNSDGSRTYAGLDPESDTEHELMANINGNSALFGIWVRPASNFRTSVSIELFSGDESLMRTTPRRLRHYQVNSTYTPVQWAVISGSIDIIDGSNSVTEVQGKENNQNYAISAVFTPNSRFSFDLSYNYSNIYSQAFVCFPESSSGLPPGFIPTVNPDGESINVNTCPLVDVDGESSPGTIGALSVYQSKSHFANADVMFQPVPRVTFTAGYAGSFVRGTPSFTNPTSQISTNFLNANTPWGPLRFNYQLPYVTLNWNIIGGFSYIATWNYYGYNGRPGYPDPLPLGTQDFNGNNMTLSVRYAF